MSGITQVITETFSRAVENHHGNQVVLDTAKKLEAGEVVDLTPDIQANYDFFSSGPGYGANDTDDGM